MDGKIKNTDSGVWLTGEIIKGPLFITPMPPLPWGSASYCRAAQQGEHRAPIKEGKHWIGSVGVPDGSDKLFEGRKSWSSSVWQKDGRAGLSMRGICSITWSVTLVNSTTEPSSLRGAGVLVNGERLLAAPLTGADGVLRGGNTGVVALGEHATPLQIELDGDAREVLGWSLSAHQLNWLL